MLFFTQQKAQITLNPNTKHILILFHCYFSEFTAKQGTPWYLNRLSVGNKGSGSGVKKNAAYLAASHSEAIPSDGFYYNYNFAFLRLLAISIINPTIITTAASLKTLAPERAFVWTYLRLSETSGTTDNTKATIPAIAATTL